MLVRPRHPLCGDDASAWSLTSVAAMSSPCSRSLLQGMGIAAEGDSFLVSAACVWMSLEVEPSEAGVATGEGARLAVPACRDRTTSPLQIGQVLRRVVSHGVLCGVSL